MESQQNIVALPKPWSAGEKIVFRFFFIYFLLNILPVFLPFPTGQEWLTNFVGKTAFGIPQLEKDPLGGSGDSHFDWVWQFTMLLLAMTGTVIWSILDRRRASYNQAKWGLDFLTRYFLIYMMFSYGFGKVFAMQMPAPSENRLWQHVGDMSPMGMLWTFIGSSTPYQIFCGSIEVLAAVLLLFRNTLLLGALVSALAMGQIFALNMCYDVPVKIFSFTLFVYALYLAVPFLNRLYRFFIANQPVERLAFYEISQKGWARALIAVVKLLLVGVMAYAFYQEFAVSPPVQKSGKRRIEGNYVVNGASRQVGNEAWTNVSIRSAFGRNMFSASNEELGTRARWFYSVNDTTNTLKLSPIDNKDSVIAVLNYEATDSTHLALKGLWQKDSISIALSKRPRRDFILVKRGFHWINNEPFNR